MIHLIVVTHGDMAEGMKSSVKMLMGEPENVDFVCFGEEMGQEELKEVLDEKVTAISAEDQYLFFCDIKGGTPFNVVSAYSFKNENVAVFYGVNLPVLVECITSRAGKNLADMVAYLEEVAGITLGISEI